MLGFLLAQLGTHAHRRFAERLARLDLHPRHFGMLSHLAASEGQSQQALSNALGIHRSAVVALVDDLEHRGLAERRRDPVDRRAYTLYLTPAGRDLLADLERVADERDVELLSALNASERSQLISLLAARCRVTRPHGGRSSESGAARGRRSRRRARTVRPSTRGLGDGPAEGCVIGPASSLRQPEPKRRRLRRRGFAPVPPPCRSAMAVTIARPSSRRPRWTRGRG